MQFLRHHSLATIYFGKPQARLAQSVEHQTFNLRVAGSSPSSGGDLFRKEFKLQLVSVRVTPNFLCDGFHPWLSFYGYLFMAS